MDLKPDGLSPIQALEALYALQKKVREGGEGNDR